MTVIEHDVDGPELNVALLSDLHIGSLHTDYRMIQRELDRAVANNAVIAINGDILDAILPGDRKRYRASDLHPRMFDAGDDMVGEAINWAAEILAPYANRIIMLGDGNHDDAVSRYHHIEPVKHLCVLLQNMTGHAINYGGYHGFLHFRLKTTCGHRAHYVMHYHHGAGGGGAVTKGIGAFHRANAWIEGADALWRGHTHTITAGRDGKVVFNRDAHNPLNRVETKDVLSIRTGAYMDTYKATTPDELAKRGRKDSYAALWDCSSAPKGGSFLNLKAVAVDTQATRSTPRKTVYIVEDTLSI